MKTKLLLVFLFAFSIGNAQFSINESFEIGLPSGWTVDGLGNTPTAFGACTGTNSMAALLNASNPFAIIYTDTYTSNGNAVAISFNRRANTTAVSGTAFLFYQIGTAAWQLITSEATIPVSCTSLSFNIPAGTIPNGSSVKFRMQMNSTSGETVYFDDFSAVQTGSPAPVISNLSSQVTSSTSADLSFFIQNSCIDLYYAIQFSTSSGFYPPSYTPTTLMTDCSASAIQKTVSLSGLTPNTIYYYRILASENSNILVNTAYSATASFSTGIVLSNLDHENITPTTADIVFSIQNNCTSTDYQIQYSTSVGFTGPLYSTLTNTTECSTTALNKTVQLAGLTTGVTYYYRIMARYFGGAWVYSSANNFRAGDVNILQLNHQNVTASSADINYTVQNNCAEVFYKVEYSKFSGFSTSLMSDQLSTSACVGNSFNETTLLTNLTGGTTYYYRLLASYSASGPWTISPANSFTTLADPSGLIHEWKFDTTYLNESNTVAFTPVNPGTGFSADRFGQALKAVFTTTSGGGSVVNVPNLPINNQARTVSLWVRVSQYLTGNNNVFFYGTGSTGQGFGIYFNRTGTTTNLAIRGFNDDVTYTIDNATGTWRHVVASYDGTTARLYLNGVLVASAPKNWTTTGTNASFGGNYDGRIDDLKIYNRAINATEVENLFYYNNVTVPTPLVPSISAVSVNTTSDSATVNYSLNANNASATSIVKYGLSSSALDNQVTGFAANFNTLTNGNAVITGLTANTQYFYQIEATNTAGTSQSAVGTFTTTDDSPIANYPFNNSLNNAAGNSPFSAPFTSFINDRFSQSNAALQTTNPSSATISNLPLGNSPRTVSFWFKKGALTGDIQLFKYGTNANSQIFGSYLEEDGNYFFQGFANDQNFGGTAPNNTWTHLVVSYSGTVVKMYVNGLLLGSVAKSLNTGSSSFAIGHGGIAIDFDDLNIFNYELSSSQVASLYNNNTLSSQNFPQNNLEVALYPNPVKDMLNIEMTNEVKSIEIYNIQGQKVLSSNQKQINVSNLAAGMYMVRIEDIDNNSATKKIVIK